MPSFNQTTVSLIGLQMPRAGMNTGSALIPDTCRQEFSSEETAEDETLDRKMSPNNYDKAADMRLASPGCTVNVDVSPAVRKTVRVRQRGSI